MRVIRKHCNASVCQVGNVCTGKVVRFLESFHPSHDRDDYFMVCNSPDGYRPEHDRCGNKIPITNLSTGKIHYVMASREVVKYQAEVAVGKRQHS